MRIKLQHAKHTDYIGSGLVPTIPIPLLDPDRFYFEIQADGNHETILTSEIYDSHRAAMHAIALLRADGFEGHLLDLTVSRPPSEG